MSKSELVRADLSVTVTMFMCPSDNPAKSYCYHPQEKAKAQRKAESSCLASVKPVSSQCLAQQVTRLTYCGVWIEI